MPKDSVSRLHTAQHKNQHCGSERLRYVHIRHWKTRSVYVFYTGKQMNPQKHDYKYL